MPAYLPTNPAVVAGIVRRLKRAGHSQRDLAAFLGVAVSAVNRSVTGKAAWGVDEVVEIASSVGWDVVFGGLAASDGWLIIRAGFAPEDLDELAEGNAAVAAMGGLISAWMERSPDGIDNREAAELLPLLRGLRVNLDRLIARLEAVAKGAA